jgi:hypothetical protein
MPERMALAETQILLSRAAQLRDLLDVVIERTEGILANMEEGAPAAEALLKFFEVVDLEATIRPEDLTLTLRDFEGTRYRWRVAFMRCWLADGHTITEYAERFGFTRQYAGKLARASRGPSHLSSQLSDPVTP